jgi:hypothetical protein
MRRYRRRAVSNKRHSTLDAKQMIPDTMEESWRRDDTR